MLLGGNTNKRKTDGEEARGGERDACVVNLSGDMELGRGDLGGGERKDHSHQWTIVLNPKYRPELSVWVAAVRGSEPIPPYNEHAIWAW